MKIGVGLLIPPVPTSIMYALKEVTTMLTESTESLDSIDDTSPRSLSSYICMFV